MATLNKVFLMGRLTADPEAPRKMQDGGSVVNIRIAVGRSRKNAQTGQWENDPNPLYIDCEAWTQAGSKRDLVSLIHRNFKKGDPIFLEGRLKFEQWDDKNGGGKRSKHKVIIDGLEFIGGGNAGGNEQPSNNQQPSRQPQHSNSPDNDDPIPF